MLLDYIIHCITYNSVSVLFSVSVSAIQCQGPTVSLTLNSLYS